MIKKTEFMFDWIEAIGNGTIGQAIEKLSKLNLDHDLCVDIDSSYVKGYYASIVKTETVDETFDLSKG